MLHHGALICSESGDIRYSCIDYNGDLVAVGNARGAIYFYRLVSKTTRLRPELALHVAPPANDKSLNVTLTCIRFSTCQTYLAVGTASGIVLVFNLKDKCRLDIKSHHDDHRGKAISALCWSHDSSKLFSGCIGGVVIEFIFSDSVSDWNSKSASTSSMALNFASALLLGKKNITLICQCEEIIRQIECTFSESCSTGAADILLVSVGHHSLLFQLPKKKSLAPRFCDIPLLEKSKLDESEKSQDNNGNDIAAHFDELWCASCFYSSYSQVENAHIEESPTSNSLVGTADGIIIALSTETGIELIFSSLDGELLQYFKLTGPYRKHGDEGSWDSCCLGVRCLTSFNSMSHKHLMTLITADNCVMLINLLDMSCDYLLSQFDYAVHAAVPNSGRLLILYEVIEQERMMADLIECFAPSTATLPLKAFDSHLHFSLSLLKNSWQIRKEQERAREAEAPAALLTPTSTSSYMSDGGNSFQYYEPGPDSDLSSNAIISQDNGNRCSRFCTKIFRSVSDLERARDLADLAIRKKLDDLEDDLNHALTDCDEHLEAWAFSASAPSSLSGYMGEPCVCCCHHGNSELGGGGGGIRSLDEIVKYGAILNASQGVCLSEEAISQLSSLQHVLSAIDADEAQPKKRAIGVGYDCYGLEDDDVDQQNRRTIANMVRSRAEERRKCLNMVLSESYSQEDLILPLESSFLDTAGEQCAAVDRSATSRKNSSAGLDIASEAPSRCQSEKSNTQEAGLSSLLHIVGQGGSTDCEPDIPAVGEVTDVSEDVLRERRLAAIDDQMALLMRADKVMRNTSKVLDLCSAFHSVSRDRSLGKEQRGNSSCRGGTRRGDGHRGASPESAVPVLFDEDCDTMLLYPWELLERAEGAIQSTILVIRATTCSATLRSSSSSASCSRMWNNLSDAQKTCTFCGKDFPATANATATNSPPGASTPNTKNRAQSYSSSNGIGSVSNSSSSNSASHNSSRADTEEWDDQVQVHNQSFFVPLKQELEVNSEIEVKEEVELEPEIEIKQVIELEPVIELERLQEMEEIVKPPSRSSAAQISAEIPRIPISRTPSPTHSPPSSSSSSSPHSLSLYLAECTPSSPDEQPKRRKSSYARKASQGDESINRCDSVCTDSVLSNCPTEDSGPSPFTDSDISWMEWWWDLDPASSDETVRPADEPGDDGQPGVALKARLLKARSTKRRIAGLGGSGDFSAENPLLPRSRIQRVVREMDTVLSLLSLRQDEAPRNMYDVIVIAPRGLGLNLALIPGGALVLRTFNPLADGHPGPVERTGVVKGGDYLLGINGLSLIGLGLEQIAEILQNIDRMGEEPITLTFRYGDLSSMDDCPSYLHTGQQHRGISYPHGDNNSADGQGYGHSQGYYAGETRYNLLKTHRDQPHERHSQPRIQESRFDGNPLLDLFEPASNSASALPFSYDMDNEDALFGSGHFGDHGSRNGMAPAWVEDLLLNPLSAVQVAAANIGPIGGLESLGLGSWLDNINMRAPKGADGYKYGDYLSAQYGDNPLCSVSAVVDTRTMHAAIRKRHMYPSVATVSCSSYESALAALTQKVAREVWQWRATVPRGAGYFLPSPQWDYISPLIGTVCVGADGNRGGVGEWDVISEYECFDAVKHIDEAYAQERMLSSFNELTLHTRAQNRAKIRAEQGRCSPYEMYESYPYDKADLGSHNPAHTVRYISSGAATPELTNGPSMVSSDHVQDRITGTTGTLGTATCSAETYSGGIEALQQELLTDLQIEFSQKVRQATAKKNVKHGQANQLAAHLPPISLTMRLKSILCSPEYSIDDGSRLLVILSTWTQLFSPLPSQQRSKFSYKHISPAFASSHGFDTNTDMADFLCILTDLTSLHFMVLFCFDNLRTGSVGSVQSTAAVWDHKIYDRERDSVNPMLQDEEDYEWGDKEDNERLDLSSESFTQGDWCLELSSSCRLQLLPFHIAYSEQEYPVTDRNKQHKQDECLPPSYKSLCSVSGQSVWVEVDSLKDGTEHLPSSDKCSEHERKVSYGDRKDSNREKERKSDTDNGACEYVQQYGSYLNLDLVAACCSLRELPLALDSTLLVAGADQQLDTLSSSLGHTLKTTDLTAMTPRQLMNTILDLTPDGFHMFFCLILRHLGPLYKKDESLAAATSSCLSPILRPWNVKRTLFGDSFNSLLRQTPPTPDPTLLSCKYFCGVRGNTSDGRSSIGPPYKGCDGDNTVHPANTPQSHLCLPGDPEHACSDALLVWQTSAKHYYRSYLLHLLHRARHIQGNTGSSCGVNRTWGEEVTDLLHLSLFLISEEESKRIRLHRAKINPNPNPNLNRRNSGNSKEGLLERTCALSCCTEKYEHHCLSGENNRQGKRGEKSEIALCLQTVRGIVSHSSGLNYSNTAATAALCAAYGCHKEALRACRDHLSNCAGEGGEEGEVQVRAALLQSLQMSLCRLVKGLLHEQAVVPLSCHPTRGRDAAAAASRAPSMGGMSCEASKDVELAVKLLWISLVRSEGGEVNIRDVTPDCKKDDAGRIVDMVLGSIISCIMSSPLCLCPSYVALKTPDDGPWIGSRDRGSNDLKQKQGHENCDVKGVTAGDLEICFREFLRAVCIEDNTAMDSTHGQEGLTMGLLYNAPHEDKDTDTGTDTHDCPLPSPCLPLLRRLKTAVSVSVSRCILSALGSKLTRQFVRALPPMFSDHLDIDFFAELDD